MADLLEAIKEIKADQQYKYFIIRNLYEKRNSQTNKDIDDIKKLSKQSNDDLNILKALPIQINNLETKLMLAEDSIQALESYKKQINQTILEIQSEISNLAVDKEVPTVIEDGEGI